MNQELMEMEEAETDITEASQKLSAQSIEEPSGELVTAMEETEDRSFIDDVVTSSTSSIMLRPLR